jgi:hypothetical protein
MIDSDLPSLGYSFGNGPRFRVELANIVNEALADASGGKRQILTTVLTAANTALNPSRDTTAPTVSSRVGLGNEVTITYSEGLDPYSAPAPTTFVTNPARTITGVRVKGAQVIVTYAGAPLANSNTIAYTQPGATAVRLRDQGGNLAASFTAAAITVA